MSVLFPELSESLNIRLFSAGYITVDQWWKETDLLRGFWRLYLHEQEGVELSLEGAIFMDSRYFATVLLAILIPSSVSSATSLLSLSGFVGFS